MSIKWMAMVWEDAKDVEGTELLVLLSIADHASDNGKAFPSVGRLAKRARRAERTVQEALSSLEAKGWLVRVPRPGQSTEYWIQWGAADRTPAESAPLRHTAPHPRSTPHPTPAVDRTHNHQGTTNEPGGAVEEVSTEQQQPSTSSEDVKDAAHTPASQPGTVTRPVTTLPQFARAALGNLDNGAKAEWVSAWQTIAEQVTEETLWDPIGHLTRYFVRCKQLRKEPTPDEWMRWYTEDEAKARREYRIERENHRDAAQESHNPFWQ